MPEAALCEDPECVPALLPNLITRLTKVETNFKLKLQFTAICVFRFY